MFENWHSFINKRVNQMIYGKIKWAGILLMQKNDVYFPYQK